MTGRHLAQRLLALARRSRLERELQDEIAAHLEMAERDALARGLSPADARLEARRHFGGVDQVQELHRDARSVRWLDHVVRDARHAVIALGRERAFATLAIGVLALGIGVTTAMFSLVDGVLFKPLPFPAPERIVRVWETPTATTANSTTTRTFVELVRQTRVFEALSAESNSTATVDVQGVPVRLTGRYVSADHFTVFGVQPMLGRAFHREEDQPGHDRVLILSHAAWRTHFGSDPTLIGRDVRLDNVPYRVIGVLPPGVFDRQRSRPLDEPASFWRLNGFTEEELTMSAHWLNPVGRLKSGVTLAEADADVKAVRARIADLIPAWKQHWNITAEPFDRLLLGDRLRQAIYVALGAVVLVLLIACANVTNLLLTRSAARQKELAVRAALGAGRGRLAAQLLVESLVLGLAGGAAGVGVAAVLVRVAMPLLPPMPFTADVVLDLRVLAFATTVAVGAAVLVGLLPAIRLSRGPAAETLNAASRGSSGAHDATRRTIVAVEVAVSVVLLCGATLLFQSLTRLRQVDVGARLDGVVTMSVDLPRDRYPNGDALAAFYPVITERVQAVPGVVSASIAGDVPLEGTGGENLRLPGHEDRVLVRFKRADHAYFDTLGIPVLQGRGFTAADRVGAPYVTVINEALAARLRERFAMADPVGRLVDLPVLGFGPDRRGSMTVVGVVGNERVRSDLRAPAEEVAYVPMAQAPRMQVKLAVRARGDAATAVPAIREAVRLADPGLALADIRTMSEIWQGSLSGLTEPAWLVSAFAVVSALLAAIGVYGVLTHAVAQRRREIGIRMALGAGRDDVVRLVMRGTLTTVALGLAAGIAGAAALSRVMQNLLFEVSALDPTSFIAGAAAMVIVAAAAAFVPARRAAGVDPSTALRSEG